MDDGSAAKLCRAPTDATIDELIQWLAERRADYPEARLNELIDERTIPAAELIELACVDLIRQRRRGQDVLAEHYLSQFAELRTSHEAVLDLLDAEICVRRETDQLRSVNFFVERFPKLAIPIRQLLHLEMTPPSQSVQQSLRSQDAGSSIEASSEGTIDQSCIPAESLSIANSVEASFESCERREITVPKGKRARDGKFGGRSDDSIDAPIPIPPPGWMGGARCIASSPTKFGRYWLVTGRDIERGETVAMKILPLPTPLGRTQRTRILDLCEKTSSLSHLSWIPPRVAAISNGHLAVIRPWIFGTPLGQMLPLLAADAGIRHLIRIAFALSAAHQSDATHGSISAHNTIVDHDSNVTLVDAASGIAGWIDYLSNWQNDLSESLPTRIRLDTIGLMRMVSAQCFARQDRAWSSWPGRLTEDLDFCEPDACAAIGEKLQSFLDQPPKAKRRWW